MSTTKETRRSQGATAEKSAHTPGPWRIQQPPKFDKQRIAVVHSNGTDIDMNQVWSGVAVISVSRPFSNRNEPSEREQANARLIAAAPELLEALKRFHAEAQSYHQTCGHGETGAASQCDSICELLPIAASAIEKAEGK